MSDSDQWLDLDNEALGRTLLEAGAEERPNPAALGRALTAVGAATAATLLASKIGAATASASSASAISSSGVGSTTAKVASGVGAAGSLSPGASTAGAGLGASLVSGAGLSGAAKGTMTTLAMKWIAGGTLLGVTTVSVIEVVDEPSRATLVTLPAETAVSEQHASAEKEPEAVQPELAEKKTVPEAEQAVEALEPASKNEPKAVSEKRGAIPPAVNRWSGESAPEQKSERRPESGFVTRVGESTNEAVAIDEEPNLGVEDGLALSELEEQLSLIDEARALLASSKGALALVKLNAYQQRFGRGRLGPEALFLRMQAHRQLGQLAMAKRAAEEILERYPEGPHAGKARELLSH